jgi:hypothetical protein
MNSFKGIALGGVLLLALAGVGFAAQNNRRRPPRRPPAEAVDACVEKDAGDTCCFDFDGRTLCGECNFPPGADTLACEPENHRPPPRPPKAAVDACKDKSAGDTCRFTHRKRRLNGTCKYPPQANTLVCVPHDHRPPPTR